MSAVAASAAGSLLVGVECPICGDSNTGIYLDGTTASLSSSELGSSRKAVAPGRILRCKDCSFAFKEARSSDRDLATLYRELDGGVYESESRGRLRTARRHLKIVERFASRGKLLDVGCASGLFLKCASEAGWNVCGIEPAAVLARNAERLLAGSGRVVCASLLEADLAPASFHVITLWDVLEHVNDPISTLRRCFTLLRPGAYLFLNVPDINSLPARLLRSRWPLLLPEHLSYFTRESLKRCGKLSGLEPVSFLRRPASFSLEYVFYRLMQHGIPGSRILYAVVKDTPLGDTCIPVMLGETCAVWRCPSAIPRDARLGGSH